MPSRPPLSRVAVPASAVLLLALWQFSAAAIDSPLILPYPRMVWNALIADFSDSAFLHHVAATVGRVCVAFAISLATGSILGALSGVHTFFRRFTSFPLSIIRAVPVVSIILLSLFWLGTDAVPVFTAVLMTLPVITDSVSGAIEKMRTPPDSRLLDASRTYGFSGWRLICAVYIPAAIPALLSGARSAFGLSWKVVIAGETLSLPHWGSGSLLFRAKTHLEMADMFAVTIFIVLLCFAFETLLFSAVNRLYTKRRPPKTDSANTCSDEKFAGETFVSAPSAANLKIDHFSLTRSGHTLFSDFSLDIQAGSVTALIAASGSGKTSLLDAIAGILPFDGGTISLGANSGEQHAKIGHGVSYLFQDALLFPRRTVLENVRLPLQNKMPAPVAQSLALHFLEKTELLPCRNSYPAEISGGEKQRAALARAFSYPAPVLLMDEAFQSQDIPLKLSLLRLTQDFLFDQKQNQNQKRTVILVTHDIREALALSDRIVVLTGSPLTVARDISLTAPNAGRQAARTQSVEDSYLHLSVDALRIEEDILHVLSNGICYNAGIHENLRENGDGENGE